MTMTAKTFIMTVFCISSLLLPAGVRAQTLQERLISSTFKTLAKTYVSASDMEKLKKNTLESMAGLDTGEFRAKYPRTLQLIGESPALAKQFGLRPDMSVEQARSFVRSMNKKKACMVIDAAADGAVARHVLEDISRRAKAAGSNNIADQVSAVWRALQDRLDRTAHRSPS